MSKDIDEATMRALSGGQGIAVPETGLPVTTDKEEASVTVENGRIFVRDKAGAAIKATIRLGVFVLIAIGLLAVFTAPAVDAQQRPTYKPRSEAAREWHGLTATQLVSLQKQIVSLNKNGQKVEIYCGGFFCRRLAEDLDEMFESSGWDSTLPLPIFDLGKGLGISPKNPTTEAIAKIFSELGFEFSVLDVPGQKASGSVVIAIGRRKPGR